MSIVMLYNICHVMLYNVHVMLYNMCDVMLYNMGHVGCVMLCYIT